MFKQTDVGGVAEQREEKEQEKSEDTNRSREEKKIDKETISRQNYGNKIG